MNKDLAYSLAAIAVCASLIALIWFAAISPQLVPVWTDQGKITSIKNPSGPILPTWEFTVATDHHGTVSPVVSNCGWEMVGNNIYVTLLTDGKYGQTDSSGNILQCNS